jgi:hypothetical protein
MRREHLNPLGGREGGQALVEFALVIVFVFLLFVCALQMILLMSAYNTFADAAKEGVRYAIVHGTGNSNCSGPGNPISNPIITCPDPPPYPNVQQAVVNFAALSFQNVTTNDVTVDYDPGGANTGSTFGGQCSAPGCIVKITVAHTYTPLFGLGWPNITLNAAASGRVMN